MKESGFRHQRPGAYSRMKYESGVHRSSGCRKPNRRPVHTIHRHGGGAAEMEEVDVQINPADIEMQVYRPPAPAAST